MKIWAQLVIEFAKEKLDGTKTRLLHYCVCFQLVHTKTLQLKFVFNLSEKLPFSEDY